MSPAPKSKGIVSRITPAHATLAHHAFIAAGATAAVSHLAITHAHLDALSTLISTGLIRCLSEKQSKNRTIRARGN